MSNVRPFEVELSGRFVFLALRSLSTQILYWPRFIGVNLVLVLVASFKSAAPTNALHERFISASLATDKHADWDISSSASASASSSSQSTESRKLTHKARKRNAKCSFNRLACQCVGSHGPLDPGGPHGRARLAPVSHRGTR